TISNYSGFIGGSGSDTFTSTIGKFSFDGGGGDDTLNYTWDGQPATIDLQSGTVAKGTGSFGPFSLPFGGEHVANSEPFEAGSGDPTFISAAGNNYTFNGGSGKNTLSYYWETTPVTTLLLTATSTASKNGGIDGTDTFTNIQSFVGGSNDDIFTF